MKVDIGPYNRWIGPYQIADLLKCRWIDDDRAHNIGTWLHEKTPLSAICNWIDSKKKRKIKIHIDNYDIWSADYTLALIIHPVLVKLKERQNGAGHVDDEDVPEELRSTSAPELTEEEKNTGHTDANYFKRWNYVLGEMIHAFECTIDEDWEDQFHTGEFDHQWIKIEGTDLTEMVKGPNDTHKWDQEAEKKAWDRRKNGLRLFAKYYHSLWD